jgi:hypothetical protein
MRLLAWLATDAVDYCRWRLHFTALLGKQKSWLPIKAASLKNPADG